MKAYITALTNMKICETPECENIVEGNTSFCASCNSFHRKIAKQRVTDRMKFEAKIKRVQQPRQKPKKVSDKRQTENQIYWVLRDEFLKEHPNCELKLLGCKNTATQIHHTASGWNKSTNLNNVKTWRASCDHCNQFLHDKISAKEARELGLKI